MVDVMSFMRVAQGRQKEVLTGLRAIPELQTVHSVTGTYDLVALFRAEDPARMGEILSGPLDHMAGITEINSHFVMETWARP